MVKGPWMKATLVKKMLGVLYNMGIKYTFKNDFANDSAEFIADVMGVTVITAWIVFIGAWTLNLMGVLVW